MSYADFYLLPGAIGSAEGTNNQLQFMDAMYVILTGMVVMGLSNVKSTTLANDREKVLAAALDGNPATMNAAQELYQQDQTRWDNAIQQTQTVVQDQKQRVNQDNANMSAIYNLEDVLNQCVNIIKHLVAIGVK